MSDTLFTVTLTAAELHVLREAAVTWLVNDETIAKLDAAKRVKRTARKPPAPAEPFHPDTGNADLDAWMRARHRPDWQARQRSALRRTAPGMISMPSPPKGWPLERSTAEFMSLFRASR